ncbi:ArnT family glycosyltransferase [Phenylobacterium montanum]|uniref:ArnT family glycosyltransferase n=1 Tax=Phenylobacterium montanum TaxID=2823693 RepID=UPI002010FF70|nr:glycosyltransferase family 39 protein [Caulobacter sp. S6]
MFDAARLDAWTRGWQGPLLAALVALAAALPGALALPTMDRDEARFAQATAQMLETGDFVDIRYQDAPRDKKPVGIHWLQAASVGVLSSAEARQIFFYRIPSLLGAMLAAAACAWGAAAWFGSARGFAAGGILGACFILATEGGLAKTDAVLCGSTTLALAALGRIYAESQGTPGVSTGWRTRLLFWAGMAVAVIDKGPIGPMVALLTGLSLWAVDRRAPWARRMSWAWGLILVLAVAGPWAVAISVKTDGAFWGRAIGGDVAPKLRGGQEGHGAFFGYHALFALLLTFPFTALLPATLLGGWHARKEPAVRFALCWLIPAWLVFELTPTKLPHYTLPTYGALAWLAVAALDRTIAGPSRWIGLGLSLFAGLLLAGGAGYLQSRFGSGATLPWTLIVAILAIGAAVAGAAVLLRPARRWGLLAAAGVLGLSAHAALAAGVLAQAGPFWLSQRIAAMLDQAHMNPREGLTPGPVTVVGYAEPSLVFALGTETELGDAGDGAEAISEGRPVVVEKRAEQGFIEELAADRLKASPVAQTKGFDYSNGKSDTVILYRSDSPPPATPLAPPPAPPAAPPAADDSKGSN